MNVLLTKESIIKAIQDSGCFGGQSRRCHISNGFLAEIGALIDSLPTCVYSYGLKVQVFSSVMTNEHPFNYDVKEFVCWNNNSRFSLLLFDLQFTRTCLADDNFAHIFQEFMMNSLEPDPNRIVCFLFDINAAPKCVSDTIDFISEKFLINVKDIQSIKYSCCYVVGFGSIQLASLLHPYFHFTQTQLIGGSRRREINVTRILNALKNHCSSSKYLTCIYKDTKNNLCKYDAHGSQTLVRRSALSDEISLTTIVKLLCTYAPFDDTIKQHYKLLVSLDFLPQRANAFYLYRKNCKITDLSLLIDQTTIVIPDFMSPDKGILGSPLRQLERCVGLDQSNMGKYNDEIVAVFRELHSIFYNKFLSIYGMYKEYFDAAWRQYCTKLQNSQGLMDGEEFSYFIYLRSFYLDTGDYILYFPFFENYGQDLFFEVVVTDNLQDYVDKEKLHNLYCQYFSLLSTTLQTSVMDEKIRLTATKSAIGSIMSRNGSHNIGSHVLAALSHNVGTMPDDRVLYQYIQHRMDYIATATTERPQWRQPTMIVSSLMKEFLMQRHLLDHISGSEGLHAYKFQGQSIDDNDKNTIRMHIRRVRDCAKDDWERKGFLLAGKRSDESNVVDFIDYDKSEIKNPDEDVAIAVPGGVVGNHAFYTIIENVLRNAAKHEWAEAMRVWKMACELLGEPECLKTYKECQPENLDVYVDFFDKPEEGKVQCRIWNDCVVSVDDTAKIKAAILRTLIRNCDERKADGAMWEERLLSATKTLTHLYSILKKSDSVNDNELYKLINRMSDETAKKEAILSEEEKEKFDKDMEWRKAIVLGLRSRKEGGEYKIEDGVIHDFLMDGIATSTTELQGKLEGKIKLSFIDESTGSLRKENWGIAEMRISAGYLQCRGTGHIGGLPGAGEPREIIWPVPVKNDDNDKCVAYRFDIDKPKLLLVVLKSWHDVSMLRKNSMRFGIDFICREDLKSDVAYPYSYILFEHLDNELKAQLKSREIMLPYRQMYASIDGDGDGLEEYIPNYMGSFFERLEDKFTKLQESGESAAKVCYELIEEVYATWLLHVQKRGFLPRATDASPKEVVLDIGGDSSNGSGQTLISQYELLKFVFENSFNAATRSFLKENGPEGGTGSLEIENQKGNIERLIVSLPSKIAAALYAVSQMRVRRIDDEFSKRVTEGWTVPEIVNKQLNLWMEEVIGDDKKVCINLEEIDQHWARQFKDEFSLGSAKSAAIEVGLVADLNDSECDYWLGRFEDYISSTILDQAETFLSKYEERYVTLPKMPESRSNNAIHTDVDPCSEFLWNAQKLTITSNSKKRSDAIVNQDICYFRHGTAEQKTIGDNYYEPLSGSQSTFNVFRSICRDLLYSDDPATHCKIAGFFTRLVENAATRILIVDERVAKFVRDHSEVGNILGGLRIAVADDTDINVMRMFSSEQIDDTLEFSKVELKKFEIVIIHQGIIDKLLHGHEDKYRVRDWLDKLVEKLHYVVITTGRGSPSNIPDTARVLPYSVIENSILQRFPEKMLLVDAIMNILPVKKGEK